jgi:hypothetical protein
MSVIPETPLPRKSLNLRPIPMLIFGSRWLQLPLYVGLIVAQGVYVVLFLKELWHLFANAIFRQKKQNTPSRTDGRFTGSASGLILTVAEGKARLVGKVKAARDRKRATVMKVKGRKSYAEIDAREHNGQMLALAGKLRRKSPKEVASAHCE